MSISQPLLTRTQQEVRYGATTQRIICWPEVNGAVVDPDAGASVTIYTNGGAVTAVSGATATEHADGYLYYDLDASDTAAWLLGVDYGAEFTFVSGGLTYVRRVLFDVVLLPLLPFCPVRVDDLKNSHATIDAALTQSGESTDVAGRYILPAWVEVCQWARAQGYRPGLISDSTVLYAPTLAKALHRYWTAHRQEPGDIPSTLAAQYAEEFTAALDRVVLKWDPNQSRATETKRGASVPAFLIGPDHTPWGIASGGAGSGSVSSSSGGVALTPPGDVVWVSPEGADTLDTGRGAATRPFLTLQAALNYLGAGTTAPTSSAEYLSPATVFLAPGTYNAGVGTDFYITTKGQVTLVLLGGASITSPLRFTSRTSYKFGNVTPVPTLEITYLGQRQLSPYVVGDGTDSIKVVSSAGDVASCRIKARGVRFSGQITSDGNYTSGLTKTVALDVDFCTVAGLVSLPAGVLTLVDTTFTSTVDGYYMNAGAVRCNFSNNVTLVTGQASGTNSTNGAFRACGFTAGSFSITVGAAGILNIDTITNYNLKTAGWAVHPATATVVMQHDETAVVPS